MHVMNCVSLVNDKENGAISVETELMIGDTTEPEEQQPPPPPPLPPPLPCLPMEAGLPSPAGVPPPPPPPPPVLSRSPWPPLVNGHGHSSKKKRIRSFFWKTIPEEQVRGKNNIWTIGAKQNYQIDTKTIEEFFGQKEESPSPGSRSRTLRRSFKDSKQEINILDAKRSMNIGIFLKQFKKSFQCIIDDLHSGRCDLYSCEVLRELLKLLPETEEVKKLKDFNGDLSKLCQPDSFMYRLIQVPNYSLRLEAMVLKKEFSPSCTSLQKDMTIIRMATKELMCCEELHSILHLVLQAGNIMNAGGYAGNAVGFKLSSLLKLADTKANKPGMNLLHFVALEAQKKDKGLLAFPEKLKHVQEAARISLENIEAELHSLSTKTKSLKDNIRKDPELFHQMEGFLQFAVKELKELEHWKRDLLKEAHALIDFLCEDRETMKLEECFQIFRDFCLRFTKAVKENKERETQELQQLQRLKEMEEKRRSWITGDLGGFGRSSSETDVGTLTKRGLEEFLPFLQQRPQSPSYRNTSIRRSRHSLGVSADRELLTFLEISKGEDPKKSNSLPRAHGGQARPSTAWAETKDSGDLGLSNLHLEQSSEEAIDCSYFQLPPSESDCAEAVELDTGHVNPRKSQGNASSDKYTFNTPCMESTEAVPWDVSLEDSEFVPGSCKFDFSEANDMDDLSEVHLGNGARHPETLDDSNLYSLGITSRPIPAFRKSKEASYRGEHTAKVTSHVNDAAGSNNDSPGSSDSSILGLKGQEPSFCVSDTSDCSLTLDLSEQNNPKSDGNKGNRKDDSITPFINDLQTGGNAALSSYSNDKDDSGSKAGVPKEKSARSKDGSGPKRNSLKEKSSSSTKATTTGPPNNSRPVRTLNTSENASMRKVVPISRSTKAAPPACTKKPEAKPAARDNNVAETRLSRRNSIRGSTDTMPKPQYRQSISVEEPKFQRGTPTSSSGHFEKEPLQLRGSFKKPSSKPVRYVPKSKNDEAKMCRSLPKPPSPAEAAKSTTAAAPKTPASVPSFARNTVASSSKSAKVDLSPISKAPPLTRSLSQRLPKMRMTAASDDANPKENGGSTLKRANSARFIKRDSDNSELLSVKAEPMLREQIMMERSTSLKCKDGNETTLGKLLNHF